MIPGISPEARRRRHPSSGRSTSPLLLFVAVTACAHAPPANRPYPPPTAAELLATLAARQTVIQVESARARATSWLGGERVRATVNMFVIRDGHLRFEAEVPLQGTVAALATDGVCFELLDARRNELERGPASSDNVASLIRIPLAPADVAALLLGDARLSAGAAVSSGSVRWDARQGADVLAVHDPSGGGLQVFFRGQSARRRLVSAIRTGPDGGVLWRTEYSDFDMSGAVPMPKLIRFAERNGSFDDGVDIRFKDRAVNPPVPAGAFAIVRPPGVRISEARCRREDP